jgi:hypothetical protein
MAEIFPIWSPCPLSQSFHMLSQKINQSVLIAVNILSIKQNLRVTRLGVFSTFGFLLTLGFLNNKSSSHFRQFFYPRL